MATGVLPPGLWKDTGPGLDLGWTWESRSCPEEAHPVVELVAQAMALEGYPDHDIFEMRQALEEAIDNAIRHGNRGDPEKLVRVHCDVNPERVLVDVGDGGTGFDPQTADGPGVALMRLYLSWLGPGEAGSGVTLCKYRSTL